jgi:hypothetical protein
LAAQRLDPTSFVLAFAFWAGIMGASMVASEDVMARTIIYQWLRDIPLSEDWWGALMVADALALLWAADQPHPLRRAATCLVSGLFWFFWGGGQIIGGLISGIVSSNGVWNMIAGIGLCVAGVQWINRSGAPA